MSQIKKTILVIGLIAAIMTLHQSSWARWAGGAFDDYSLLHGGGAGRIIAVFFALGALLGLFRLFIAMAIFAAAGLLAIILGLVMNYYDLVFWGVVSIILAILSYTSRKETEDIEDIDDMDDENDENTKYGETLIID